ncbi:hypothetical protein [Flavobacterium sp. J27]|uniref:hypothetical protein n=1 Tax=Flavobacterium sp. J27 TaxID=2060419 RepID=UPI001030F148|nr:hypothetical protein [Flavobacterium sp. J27]
MKYFNIKAYFFVALLNIIPLIVGTTNCSGEGCMIIILMLFYWVLWLISYIPYFLIGSKRIKSKAEKIVLFLIPSLLALLIILLSQLNFAPKDVSIIALIILPNTVLQVVLYLFYTNRSAKNK